MFRFNVNEPTDLQSIEGALSSYSTPEAAVADFDANAPGGRDYLTKQYQTILGDAFADPFADMARGENDDMIKAAMSGRSLATGSNTGMRMLAMPRPNAPLAVQADPTVANANARHTVTGPTPVLPSGPMSSLSPLGTNEVARDALLKMMQMKGNQNRLASSEMQIPDPSAANYMDVLSRRAGLTGTSEAFDRIRQSNPEALKTQTGGDPRFARLQGKDGKAIGATIHPLAFDDHFQELARQNPDKANALYHAVTNRDYSTDHDAQVQLIVEQRDARKKIIEGIKSLEADPISGDLYKVVESKDFDGSIKQQRVPITPLDKAAIEAEGGSKRIYGVDLPGMGGLQKIPGMSDETFTDFKNRASTIRAKNPTMPIAQVTAQAAASLKGEQARMQNPSALPKSSGVNQSLNALMDFQIGGVNLIPKAMNYLLTGGAYTDESQAPIPLIPHPDWANLEKDGVPISSLANTDVLRESINFLRGYPAGRTWNNQPIMPPNQARRRRAYAGE